MCFRLDFSQFKTKKCKFCKLFIETLAGLTFCYTFANAFENKRNLKQNELRLC